MRIAISLEEEQLRGLARMAHEAGLSEEELLREAVDQLLLSWRTPAIPRFALLQRLQSPLLLFEPALEVAGG